MQRTHKVTWGTMGRALWGEVGC